MYMRILAVVPMIGSGKADDPKRPMYAPSPKDLAKPSHDGIIGMQYQISDDGKFALVEFVFSNPAALRPVLAANVAAGFKSFERNKASPNAIEAEFRRFKKNFVLADFLHATPH